MTTPWLDIIGIGEDGWEGLSPAARARLEAAPLIVGGMRHLAFLPDLAAERWRWPSPMMPMVEAVLARRGTPTAVLASGDPMLHGIGSTFARRLGAEEMRILPQVSAFALACARLAWPAAEVPLVSLVTQPADSLNRWLAPDRRLVVYAADGGTAAEVAALLVARGYGASSFEVLEHLGGPREAVRRTTAAGFEGRSADLATLAITCRTDGDARPVTTLAGLPDSAFESDGQLTKRDVRAATLARLAPAPGERLWDLGAGSGSISIEWLRADPTCTAIAVERRADRAERIRRNAEALGVPGLRIVESDSLAALGDLASPDAIFIGGGIGTEGLVARCWEALPPGGRLVANVVTVEGEMQLAQARQTYGGDLIRLAVSRAEPVGGLLGWRAAMPVTQWAAVKP